VLTHLPFLLTPAIYKSKSEPEFNILSLSLLAHVPNWLLTEATKLQSFFPFSFFFFYFSIVLIGLYFSYISGYGRCKDTLIFRQIYTVTYCECQLAQLKNFFLILQKAWESNIEYKRGIFFNFFLILFYAGPNFRK
jgi:hypothetical protein